MPFEVPDALRGLSGSERWVAWDDVGGRKVPKSPGGGNAKSNDPSTWGSLADAEAAAERWGYSGVGIELGDGLVGIDLDGCVRDGAIEPWAREIIDAIGSYTEVSPSGTGVHILAYADPRTTGVVGRADHRRGIEVYNHGRYFTVTGNQVGDSGIADRTDEVASLVSERFPSESPESSFSRQVARLARDQVARRANETTSFNVGRDARRGARFARVPMGAHTCQFCLMLASRGFVYHSAKTAGEFAHYHSDCRCKVVVGFPEMTYYYKNGVKVSRGVDPTVEGYDPDALFSSWQRGRETSRIAGEGLRSDGDPAVEYYGPISETERKAFEDRCAELGVEVLDSTEENIGFQPGLGEHPPQIRIPRAASHLAYLHELDHAEYDAENGGKEMIFYVAHAEVWEDMERRAYGIEIKQAEQDGYTKLADRLRNNLAKEVRYIEKNYGSSQ